jgi:hypothetical protein
MNLFFPQVGAAIVTRKCAPKGGQLITVTNDMGVYLICTTTPPRGAEIAGGPLGGWNFEDGVCVHLVYASRRTDMYRYRFENAGSWIVPPRELPNGFVALIKTHTGIPVSMPCTAVVIK